MVGTGPVLCALALLLFAPGVALATNAGDDCVDGEGATGVAACERLARELSADLARLRTLANTLENDRRYAAAGAVYAVARHFYPQDRAVLQGYIRTRSAARQLQASGGASRADPDSTNAGRRGRRPACWADMSEEALSDCRRQLAGEPQPAVLHERIGDILRARGRGSEAIDAYEVALQTQRDDAALQAKLSALRSLTRDTAPVESDPGQLPAQSEKPDGVVQQLELLETLLARGLIDTDEYAARRVQILNTALAASAPAVAAAPQTPLAAKTIDRQRYGRYLALVIGNARYRVQQRLRTPVSDAEAVSSLLERDYGFEVTTLKNADRYAMAKALSDLRKDSRPNDNVLVYFAGHGYLDDVTRRGYWLPVDAETDSYANWISTSDVTDTLAAIPARHAIVIADSCFSGSLLRSGALNGAGDPDTISKLHGKRSRTVITSGGMEPVLDGARSFGNGRHSVFASALLAALRANDGPVEAGRLFLEIRDAVSNNAEQTPQYAPIRNAGHDGGDFIFVPNARACDELRDGCRPQT